MLEYFSNRGFGIAMETFEEVMNALKEGQVEYGVLPLKIPLREPYLIYLIYWQSMITTLLVSM